MKARGRLIVFEGTDGVGKATQAARLVKRLRAAGEHVTIFSSPRYDLPTGKLVRRALSGEFGDFVAASPYLSALPYLVDFAAWRDEILAALEKGTVVCDRYAHSTAAYAAAKLGGSAREKFLREFSRIAFGALGLPQPDTVLLLDVPVDISRRLMAKRKQDQFEKNAAYQRKVALVYRHLARQKAWKTIPCTDGGAIRSRDDIAVRVWEALSR